MTELLTTAEHDVIELLGRAFSMYASEVVGPGRTGSADRAEFAARVHDLQHAVMAQAAARAYPDRYRLAGETLPAEPRSRCLALLPGAMVGNTTQCVRPAGHTDAHRAWYE